MGSLLAWLGWISRQNFWMKARKGEKNNKSSPHPAPYILLGCRVLLTQGFEFPVCSGAAKEGFSSPPACRTPKDPQALLAGQVTPPLPRIPGSVGDQLCTAPTQTRGIPWAGRQPAPCHRNRQRCHEVGLTHAGLPHGHAHLHAQETAAVPRQPPKQ